MMLAQLKRRCEESPVYMENLAKSLAAAEEARRQEEFFDAEEEEARAARTSPQEQIDGYRVALAELMRIDVRAVAQPGQQLTLQLAAWKRDYGEDQYNDGATWGRE
jgi:hypothetical protein